MKRPHLLRVDGPPSEFEDLLAAIETAGLRFGWLRLGFRVEPPPELKAAAERGALRAVALDKRCSLSLKALSGPPVLDDILRQHFLGCSLILVAGSSDLPRLERGAGSWRISVAGNVERELTTVELVSALRSPRPLVGIAGEGVDRVLAGWNNAGPAAAD